MHQRHTQHAHHRLAVLGAGLLILAAIMALLLALPSRAGAAPYRNRGLTIAATPDPITAGQGVLIYGQLRGPNNADRRILLFHRVNPAARFTLIGAVRTSSTGTYELVRAGGIVDSNRSWFALGPGRMHSRTIHEWVAAVVTLTASTGATTTSQPAEFGGTVSPAHRHQRVLLQEQASAAGNGWKTVASGYTNGASEFTIMHRFRSAGSYTLRAFLPRDARNLAGQSPSVSLTVQQQENPSFTIAGSTPVVADGQTVTINGTLYAPGSTTAIQPGVPVTLYGRAPIGPFRALASTTTSGAGTYSFTQVPLHNTVYYVAAGRRPRLKTAALYVGVQDVVSAALSSSALAAGDTVRVTGTVSPDHGGHVVYLQEQGAGGQWLVVGAGFLGPRSRFALRFTPGQTGTVNLRVQVTGGPWNVGGVSAPMALAVSGVAPTGSLPPAS